MKCWVSGKNIADFLYRISWSLLMHSAIFRAIFGSHLSNPLGERPSGDTRIGDGNLAEGFRFYRRSRFGQSSQKRRHLSLCCLVTCNGRH